jgi:hypothetical protein
MYIIVGLIMKLINTVVYNKLQRLRVCIHLIVKDHKISSVDG